MANLFRDRNKLRQVESFECPLHCITTHTMHWSEGELQSKGCILLPSVTILLNLIEVSLEDCGQGVHNLGWLLFHDGCVPGGGPGGEISIDVVWDIDIVWRNDLERRRVRTAWTRRSVLITVNLCSYRLQVATHIRHNLDILEAHTHRCTCHNTVDQKNFAVKIILQLRPTAKF